MKQLAVTTSTLAAVAILIAVSGRPAPRTVSACSGGIGPLEFYAPTADLIFLGTATDVGDNINRAPTLGPTETPTASPTPEPRTPAPSPEPTSPPFPTAEPANVDLIGVQASLRVDTLYAGEAPALYVTGEEARRYIETALGRNEAGFHNVSSCEIDSFVPRYEAGGQYLLYVEQQDTEYVPAVFRVDGNQVVLDDPLLNAASQGYLQMEEGNFERYFPGIPFDSNGGIAFPTSNRVPLASLLAATASLRGDTTITPPDAGSAGLKDVSAR